MVKLNVNLDDFILQKEEVSEVKWVSLNEFKNIFYSDLFCNHDKEYKDFIVRLLEERIS